MPSESLTITRTARPTPRPRAPRTAYHVGIDLGTTRTVAAVAGIGDRPPRAAELARLGEGGASVPTALFVGADGDVQFGDEAVAAGPLDPDRLVRGFLRRVGDPTPVIVAGLPWRPEELTAR